VTEQTREGGGGAQEELVRAGLLRSFLLRLRPSSHLTVRCAWCDRVKRGETWVVHEMHGLHFGRRSARASTHGICPDCLAKLSALPPK
jgi:hypothetical protein